MGLFGDLRHHQRIGTPVFCVTAGTTVTIRKWSYLRVVGGLLYSVVETLGCGRVGNKLDGEATWRKIATVHEHTHQSSTTRTWMYNHRCCPPSLRVSVREQV